MSENLSMHDYGNFQFLLNNLFYQKLGVGFTTC